jgi:hypothetical protein
MPSTQINTHRSSPTIKRSNTVIRIANENVSLPAIEKIPTPRTRTALEKATAIVAARHEAFRQRDFTSNEARRLKAAEPIRRGRALFEGVDAAESPVAAAEAAAEEAQLELDAATAAETFALRELRAAVAADREAWSATAAAATQKALLKLTTAVRMASDARDELRDQIGILGMHRLHEQNGGGPLALQHPRGSSSFDINAGIEALRTGLSIATHELAQFKPAQAAKGKKAATTEQVVE